MYYRVAMRKCITSSWRWQSTILSSLQALAQFLRPYGVLAQDRLCVFCAHSREEMSDLLERENNGADSGAVLAAAFLRERGLYLHPLSDPVPERQEKQPVPERQEQQSEVSAVRTTTRVYKRTSAEASILLQAWDANTLERCRDELECGAGDDHDVPYTFALPTSMPQVLVWLRLLAQVRRGELQP